MIADKLPDVRDAKGAVLVLRLRGRGEVGSSAIGLFRRYATDLQRGGGALLLAGVGSDMADQLKRTGHRGPAGRAFHLPGPQPGLSLNRGGFRGGMLQADSGDPGLRLGTGGWQCIRGLNPLDEQCRVAMYGEEEQ